MSRQRDFENFLINNLVYCRETHSFAHRLYDKFEEHEPDSYRDAQDMATIVLGEMLDEFREERDTN